MRGTRPMKHSPIRPPSQTWSTEVDDGGRSGVLDREPHICDKAVSAEILQPPAVQEEGRCLTDSQSLNICSVLVQDSGDAREKLVRFRPLQIETYGSGNFPGDIHLGRAMNGPAGLLFQKCIQHRLELVLHPRGLQ